MCTLPESSPLECMKVKVCGRVRKKKSKRKGAAEKAKNEGLKTRLSALHAQTLEAITLHFE